MSLSVCIICKDEEKNIAKCISFASFIADEIIVVDTGSTDRTIEIVEFYGIKPYSFIWSQDFAAARNFSIEKATKDWIFWMDADDELTMQTMLKVNEIKKEKPTNKAHAFFLFNKNPCDSPYVNYLNRINAPGKINLQNLHIRLFPRRADIRFEGKVHEQLLPSMQSADFDLCIHYSQVIHTGYADKNLLYSKIQRNIRLALYQSGFPCGCDFHEFIIGDYFCFYYPDTLAIWGHLGGGRVGPLKIQEIENTPYRFKVVHAFAEKFIKENNCQLEYEQNAFSEELNDINRRMAKAIGV